MTTVGGALTTRLAVPVSPAAIAFIANGPAGVADAVNSPLALMTPPPVADHTNAGCTAIWSEN